MRDKLRANERYAVAEHPEESDTPSDPEASDRDDEIEAEDTSAGVEAPKKAESTTLTRRHVVGALAVGLLAGGGGGFAVGQAMGSRRGPRKKRPPPAPAYITAEAWNPRRGPEHAKVTMVVFTDFQCPFCKRALPTYDKLFETYGDDVAMVLKQRPLEFHDKAKKAAVAMLAAGRQGKGWEMHDLMFDNRKKLSPSDLVGYAGQLGLDVEQFEEDLDDPKLIEQVEADGKKADELGATGTPTTFINGRGVRGAKPYGHFDEIVKEELAEADKLIAAGTPVADVYQARCEANVKAHALTGGKAPAEEE